MWFNVQYKSTLEAHTIHESELIPPQGMLPEISDTIETFELPRKEVTRITENPVVCVNINEKRIVVGFPSTDPNEYETTISLTESQANDLMVSLGWAISYRREIQ